MVIRMVILGGRSMWLVVVKVVANGGQSSGC